MSDKVIGVLRHKNTETAHTVLEGNPALLYSTRTACGQYVKCDCAKHYLPGSRDLVVLDVPHWHHKNDIDWAAAEVELFSSDALKNSNAGELHCVPCKQCNKLWPDGVKKRTNLIDNVVCFSCDRKFEFCDIIHVDSDKDGNNVPHCENCHIKWWEGLEIVEFNVIRPLRITYEKQKRRVDK